MAQIRPFAALRPRPDLVEQVASPPYDVVDTAGALKLAEGNPHSFLHVVRPEIDLPAGTNLYADEVYAKAAANLRRMESEGTLLQEERPLLYLYAQQMGKHRQTGLVACCSVDDYAENIIRKHEHTRRAKEDDRTRHVDETNANAGPVFLTYRARPEVDALVDEVLASEQPLYDFVAPDGVAHTLHAVHNEAAAAKLVEAFAAIDYLYVADGHHRSASAARVGLQRRKEQGTEPGKAEHDWFLTVLFPHDQLRIMPYNRVVKDLAGLDRGDYLEKVSASFEIDPLDPQPYQPVARHEVGMYLKGRWYRLRPRQGSYPAHHPTESLDVAILQANLLAPVLGIGDPRADERIAFVGGVHGPAELQRRVDAGEAAVGFCMYPVSLDELMAIADADAVMPPKSTWFEPKLRSGLLVHKLS